MADATQNASPAPAVATESKSGTPQNVVKSPSAGPTSTMNIKTEKAEEASDSLGAVPSKPESSGATPARTPTPSSTTPAQVKTEPVQSPVPATPAQKPLSISIPASTNGTVIQSSANAAAPSASETPAAPFSTLAHIFSNSVHTPAISPLSDVGPTIKRSRTPEAEGESGAEKRQKTEHVEEQSDQEMQDAEVPVDAEIEDNPFAGWDLGAQLSNILGSVEPEPSNDATAPADDGRIDLLQSIPLPPPRQRLEKMKFIENPTYFSRAMGLPTLGSLSVQILLALFQQPSEVTDRQIRDVRTEGGKVYTALRQTFMASLKLFTEATVFLNADDLDIHEPGDRETIQMANLASMCASFYGPGGPTMATAHDNFLKIMIPENGMITQDISALYLDQKTQSFLAYANVMEDKEATRNSLMEKFFPGDLEEKLKAYWRESNLTVPAEEFVKPFTDRRNLLKAIGHDKEKRKALESKYQFASFLDSLSAFIRSNFDSILDYAESHGVEVPNEAGEEDLMLMDAQSTYAGSFPGQPRRVGLDDSNGLASLITEKLTGFDGYSYYGSSASGQIPESGALPPSQSLPTSVLYERARQAAVAKSSAGARREGLQSTRRPWTPEEEKALMAGLDMVKGPHWSQILQLFGQNGTISDILKDRTQVQLKDKARNLKLFFLKTNSEMPYYLQCVTGELKTRAPSQAAKKEAEEQARVQAGGTSNGYTYSNGATNGTAGPMAHGLPMSASPRPGTTPPVPGSSTPAPNNSSHPPPQSYQQYQPPQSYQQQRPQQLQPTPNGAARPPATQGHPPAAKPLAPHSSHQHIAPAPSYQRPLQQGGAPAAAQYQQRPVQQPAGLPPASYQQMNRQAATQPASSLPPRPNPASSVPQAQHRPPAPGGHTPSPAPRPASAATATAARPPPTNTYASTTSPASGQASKGTPNIAPTPSAQRPAQVPTKSPASAPAPAPAPAPPRPAQQPPGPVATPQASAKPAQQSAAPGTLAPGPASAPAPAKPTQQPSAQPSLPQQPAQQSTTLSKPPTPAPASQPSTTPALASIPKQGANSAPAQTPIAAKAPAPAPSPAPAPAPAPAAALETPANTAESQEVADLQLLAQSLQDALEDKS